VRGRTDAGVPRGVSREARIGARSRRVRFRRRSLDLGGCLGAVRARSSRRFDARHEPTGGDTATRSSTAPFPTRPRSIRPVVPSHSPALRSGGRRSLRRRARFRIVLRRAPRDLAPRFVMDSAWYDEGTRPPATRSRRLVLGWQMVRAIGRHARRGRQRQASVRATCSPVLRVAARNGAGQLAPPRGRAFGNPVTIAPAYAVAPTFRTIQRPEHEHDEDRCPRRLRCLP